jgi:hypothetical protein
MKKLRLELDALRVETFDAGAGDGRGTVRGRESDPWTCAGDPESCGGSCDASCTGGCDPSDGCEIEAR